MGHTAIHAHWGWQTSSDKVFQHASHNFHLWWCTKDAWRFCNSPIFSPILANTISLIFDSTNTIGKRSILAYFSFPLFPLPAF